MSYGCHCCVWCRLIGVCQGNHQLLQLYPGLLEDKLINLLYTLQRLGGRTCVSLLPRANPLVHCCSCWGWIPVCDKITVNLVRCSGVPLSNDREGCVECFGQPVKSATNGCWNSVLSVMWRMVLISPQVSFSSQEPADGGINFASLIYFTCLELCLPIRGMLC